jgi:hypothetical protein
VEQGEEKLKAEYCQMAHKAGGVVTFDIGVYRNGTFDERQIETLKYVSEYV